MKNEFENSEQEVTELVFYGAHPQELNDGLKADYLDKIDAWKNRDDATASGSDLLKDDLTLGLVISYKGEITEYWPDQQANNLTETLIRRFLFEDGICTVTDTKPVFYRVAYKVAVFEDDEYLLICPFLTEAGNIAGLNVVCANKVRKM